MATTNAQRNDILQRLHVRNRKERDGFAAIILLNNKLFDDAESSKARNLEQSIEAEKLKKENLQLQIKVDSRGGSSGGSSGKAVQTLEHKVFKLQEEVTELHRKKGENSQKIIDLNNALQEKEKELQAKDTRIRDLLKQIEELNITTQKLEQDHQNVNKANEILTDEQQALHLAFVSLEEKFRKSQHDNNDLVSRWMDLKAKDADKLNAENDHIVNERRSRVKQELAEAMDDSGSFSITKQQAIQKQLEEAAKEQKHVTEPLTEPSGPAVCYVVTIPSRSLQSFEAHDGEVNSVKWGPTGRNFATGGSDRKVKMWEVQPGGRCTSKGILQGSNGAITSVEFDLAGNYILAASYDFAVRLWSIQDQRLRHTLTGHGNKVLASKFLSGANKCVSGSFDRTLKIWDLRRGACETTKFAGSSCFDLVTCDGLVTNIISGHFDRKLRFWDTRSERGANDIQLQGKVTSLDLSPDNMYLLSSTRDDTLQIIDLRMNQINKTLDADGFKVGSDWSRAVFSPDGHYVAAGSSDGAIYIWNVYKNKVEKILREHSHTVLSCSWDPRGSSILSSDKCHTVVYWSDF